MNRQTPFIGRQKELRRLQECRENRISDLVVITGRRRIGKTRLAEEFGKSFERTFLFTGLPPTKGITAQVQRDHFAQQLLKQTRLPPPSTKDWNDLFWHTAYHCAEGDVLLIIDEISWIGMKDPTFLGKLKTAWDQDFKKNSQLVVILTGSVSSWIEKNILNSTGFVGRISLELTLDELPLYRCNEFFGKEHGKISAFEKFKMLCITGGVPRYLEEIIPSRSSEENIQRLCFESGGLLVKEFERIFSDLFYKRSTIYKKIVAHLARGSCTRMQLCKGTGIANSGRFTEYLYDLETAGFISKDVSWEIKSREESKTATYRLKDNYLRFYLKYIEPNLTRIKSNRYKTDPQQWTGIFGFQFENLVLNNRNQLLKLLHIDPQRVIWDNPYLQKASARRRGCQIDYLVQTRDRCLSLCEIKFSGNPISSAIIQEIENKINALKLPLGFSVRPVLIHVNGVTPALLAEEYFSEIVDFSQFFEPPVEI
ncbi:MAG: ATP-binding protein [Waddliaceae bacterium]